MTKSFCRLLAVGDIHGHLEHLERLMELVGPTADDRVVFIGDYIDRGPDSRGVIDYLIDFGRRFPGTVFLRGNHEQMFMDAMASYCRMHGERGPHLNRLRDRSLRAGLQFGSEDADDWKLFLGNGGRSTLRSYGILADENDLADFGRIPCEHLAFLEATRLFHEESVEIVTDRGIEQREFLFVHAGIAPGMPLEEQDQYDILWIRDDFLKSKSDFNGKIIVHGHTPEHVPNTSANRICVDSGIYMFGSRYYEGMGKLTCCNVLTREIWQV